MAVLEYKPNKDLHSTVDLYYSKFKKNETMRGLMGGLGENWNGVPGAAYTNAKATPVGDASLVTSANVANIVQGGAQRPEYPRRHAEVRGLEHRVEVCQGLTGVADLSYSRADRSENVIETYAGP